VIKKAEKPPKNFLECGIRNAESIRNPKSAIRNVVSGPDAKNERSDESDRMSASDVFKNAMQQI